MHAAAVAASVAAHRRALRRRRSAAREGLFDEPSPLYGVGNCHPPRRKQHAYGSPSIRDQHEFDFFPMPDHIIRAHDPNLLEILEAYQRQLRREQGLARGSTRGQTSKSERKPSFFQRLGSSVFALIRCRSTTHITRKASEPRSLLLSPTVSPVKARLSSSSETSTASL